MAETKISRRAAFAAALVFPVVANAGAATPILELQRQRDQIQARIDALDLDAEDYDDAIAKLCDADADLAIKMAELPTESFADARLKLRVVGEMYDHPHHVDGFDLRLFDQVLAWMDKTLGVA